MLAVILTLLIGTLCGIDLYLKSYIETHYKEGEEKNYFTKMEMRATPSIRAASVMAITMMGEEAPG